MGIGPADTPTMGPPVNAQVIGIGFERCRLPTIYPQTHDIRMDAIVTDA